jgi:hypothetical protein
VERFTATSRLNGAKAVSSASTGSLVAGISPFKEWEYSTGFM